MLASLGSARPSQRAAPIAAHPRPPLKHVSLLSRRAHQHLQTNHTPSLRATSYLSAQAMNFLRNFLWNSVLSKSFTNSLLGVSLTPRAWFLKITSSSHLLFTPKELEVTEEEEGVGEAL